jgi:DNA-binding transcriptional LysR family regulator
MTNDFEIRHCRALVALKEQGSVGAAARALGLAQSTVSETLLSLERIIGAPVMLRRRGKEAALTPVAETLLPHARALISATSMALAAVSMENRALIRLGTVESVSTFLLPAALRPFRMRWPLVDVPITVGLCDDLRKRVWRGELDAALTVDGPENAPTSREPWSRMLAPTHLRLIVSSRTGVGAGQINRTDLLRRTFLLPDPHGAFTDLLRTWFQGEDIHPRFESAGSIDGVKRGVRNNDFVGVLPSYAVAAELASGSLHELRVREPLPAVALGLTLARQPDEASPLHDLIRNFEFIVDGSDLVEPQAHGNSASR